MHIATFTCKNPNSPKKLHHKKKKSSPKVQCQYPCAVCATSFRFCFCFDEKERKMETQKEEKNTKTKKLKVNENEKETETHTLHPVQSNNLRDTLKKMYLFVSAH